MDGNRIYLSDANAKEFLVAGIFSSVFGFLSNLANAGANRNNFEQNERLNALVHENSRLLREIQEKNKEKEQREIEEANIRNQKRDNDNAIFLECIQETKNKLNQMQIIQVNQDKYKIFFDSIKIIINNIFQNILGNSNLEIKLLEKSKEIIKDLSLKENEINKMNLYILGKTGTGKTTLINQICPSFNGKVGIGKIVTEKTIEYICQCKDKKHDFITMVDTRGIEINKKFGAKYVKNEAEKFINGKLKLGNPNDVIHCILFTIQGTRYEDKEIELLNELRKIYKEKSIPIIIIYTQCIEEENYINEFKKKLNQKLQNEINDSPQGIRFIDILAQEKKTRKDTYKPYNLSKLLIMCYENFKYSCSIAQKRCLLTKVKEKIYKLIDDKLLNIQENIIQNEVFIDTFLNYFENLIHLLSPFNIEVRLFPNNLIESAKSETLNYIDKLYQNFAKEQIKSISNKLLESQTTFFSNYNNFNLGDSIKSKEDFLSMCKNEINDNQIYEDFKKKSFNSIWKSMIVHIKDIFSKVIKDKIDLFLEEDEQIKNLLEDNSQCKVKMLIDKLNSLIKEIHATEEDSELEVPEILEEDE